MAFWDVLANTFAPNELAARQDRQRNALAMDLERLQIGEATSEIQRNNAYRNALAQMWQPAGFNMSPENTGNLMKADALRAVKFMQNQQSQIDKALNHVKTIGEIIRSVGGLDNFKRAYPALSKISPVLQGIDVNQIQEHDNKLAQPVMDEQKNVLGYFVFNPENGQATFEKMQKTSNTIGDFYLRAQRGDPEAQAILERMNADKNKKNLITIRNQQTGEERNIPKVVGPLPKGWVTAGPESGFERLAGLSQRETDKQAQELIAGKRAPSQIINRYTHDKVIDRAIQLDPTYNAEEADANYKAWYATPKAQLLLRRTESIIDPKGVLSEAIKYAQMVNNPAGTPINKVTGKAAVAFGNSKRQLLGLANDLTAEEMQQIFGGQGGGEKFLSLAQGLSDPNQSVEQYINSLKEIQYLIYVRQKANVRGTPEQARWDAIGKQFEKERPFVNSQPMPKKGDLIGGYIFMGGDPNDKNNWKAR